MFFEIFSFCYLLLWDILLEEWDDLKQMEMTSFGDPSGDWVNDNFKISFSKPDHEFLNNVQPEHTLRVDNFFIAPYDGLFSFVLAADEFAVLKTGSEILAQVDKPCDHSDQVLCAGNRALSREFDLKKGETVHMTTFQSNSEGPGFVQVGVQYRTEAKSWVDLQKRENTERDSYIYNRQRISVKSELKKESFLILFKHDQSDVTYGKFANGNIFDINKLPAFRLQLCGDDDRCFTTEDINLSDTLEDISKMFDFMLSTSCRATGEFSEVMYQNDFEDNTAWPGRFITSSAGSWCGHNAYRLDTKTGYSIWNVNDIPGSSTFDTDKYSDICFAFKGTITETTIAASFTRSDIEAEWTGKITIPVLFSSQDWKWKCLKITDIVQLGVATEPINFGVESNRLYNIQSISFSNDVDSEIFIDEVIIGSMNTDYALVQTIKALSYDGQVPKRIGVYSYLEGETWGNGIRITIQSTGMGSICGYSATIPKVLVPSKSNWDSTDGDLIMADGADWSTVTDLEPVAGFFNKAEMDMSAGKSFRHMSLNLLDTIDSNKRNVWDVTVIRNSEIDTDVDAELEIRYGSDPTVVTLTVNSMTTTSEVRSKLVEAWPILDTWYQISVYKGGWCNVGYTFFINAFEHGTMDDFQVTGTSNTDAVGISFEAVHDTKGSVFTQVMPGSVMGTVHTVPQVVVVANGQRSSCDNCDFEYSLGSTPIIQGISGTGFVAEGDELEVTFSVPVWNEAPPSNHQSPVLNIGGVDSICIYGPSISTPSNWKTALCTVGKIPTGTYHAIFTIPDVGEVLYLPPMRSKLVVDNIIGNLETASHYGGTILTVFGSGFTSGVSINVPMTGGAATCTNDPGLSFNYNEVTCRTGPHGGSDVNSPFIEVVTIGESGSFSLNPGEEFTITGRNFGTLACVSGKISSVLINDIATVVVSWTEIEIVARTVETKPSEGELIKVYVCDNGYSNGAEAEIVFNINSVQGAYSSYEGGKNILISGFGFTDNTVVSIGDIDCPITSRTKTELTCITGPINHQLDLIVSASSGNEISYASGDLIGQPATHFTVEVGTVVSWSWKIALVGATTTLQFQEVQGGNAETTTGHYWSGLMEGRVGSFAKVFSDVGTYHYSTGYIDGFSIIGSGTVTVIPATDKAFPVSVQSGSYQAKHINSAGHSYIKPTSNCLPFGQTTEKLFDTTKYHVIYSWAITPVIENIVVSSSSPASLVELTIASLDHLTCWESTTINFGNFKCSHSSRQSGYLVCKIVPNPVGGPNLETEIEHELSVHMDNAGNALNVFNNKYVFFPAITIVSPTSFSRRGGVPLEIHGYGFDIASDNAIQFTVGDLQLGCDLTSVEYTKLSCMLDIIATSYNEQDRLLLLGTVTINGADYELGTFNAEIESTPKINEMFPPDVMPTGTWIRFSGTNLDNLTIFGTIICESTSVEAICNISNDPTYKTAGIYEVTFSSPLGAVETNGPLVITVPVTSYSIYPTSGSYLGGTVVVAMGTGFSDDTVVQVYRQSGEIVCEFCFIKEVYPNLLIFYMPAIAVDSEDIGFDNSGDVLETCTVRISHEYIHGSSEFTFDYIVSYATISDMSVVYNSDGTVNVKATDIGDVSKITAEVVIVRDPCTIGQHYCDASASCFPTEDGLDYQCECGPESDYTAGEYWNNVPIGLECATFKRQGFSETPQEAEAACLTGNRGLQIFSVDSKYKESVLIDLLKKAESSKRGVWWNHYGKITCGFLQKFISFSNNTDDGFDYELSISPYPENCSAWGATTKQSICKIYTNRNCIDDVNDSGGYSYNGHKTTTISGQTCPDWSTTPHSPASIPEYGDHGNFCRAPQAGWFNSEGGSYCFNKWALGHGYYESETCGIPLCKDLSAGKLRQQCILRSAAPNNADWLNDPDVNEDTNCYIASVSPLKSPRSCYRKTRTPRAWRMESEPGLTDHYRFILTNFGPSQSSERQLYVDWDETDPDYIVGLSQSKSSIFGVHRDAFSPGTYSLRVGEYFVRAPKSGALEIVHERDLYSDPVILDEVSWHIECTSDKYNELIIQPENPVTIVAETSIEVISTSVWNQHTLSMRMPSLPAASYRVLFRSSDYGLLQSDVVIDIELAVSSIYPESFGTNGGTVITVTGTGFDESVTARICETELEFVSYTPGDNGNVDTLLYRTVPFDVNNCVSNTITIHGLDHSTGETLTVRDHIRRFRRETIDPTLTPFVTKVEPTTGSTAGGTIVTVTGGGFGTDAGSVSVTISNTECDVKTVSDSTITCETGPLDRSLHQKAVHPVVNIAGGPGNARHDSDDTTFWYIDRWSNSYTWGCSDQSCKPAAGDMVVITAGQVILLDETTPILSVLLIDGGTLIWDRSDGIELHMQYGIVNGNGHFEIGTEDDPFCSGNALMKLYGHRRSTNLPIYGAKVLAVRFGTIDIHGCPKTTTWTELAETVEIGTSEISLTHPVLGDWLVNEEIVIAATGDLTDFHRSEKRKIASVSSDGYKITLDRPLDHRHMALCHTGPDGSGFGWAGELCTRAEVGLLTRNVKMMGNKDNSWTRDLEECQGESENSNCFKERFEKESGSNQYGSVLFIHKPVYAKLAHLEVTHAGQAFNLARYPIHFHTPGSLKGSYVRGCAIHNTFNRALTLHAVQDMLVEYNVVYNVMGLAFFMEDAVEERNILRYDFELFLNYF